MKQVDAKENGIQQAPRLAASVRQTAEQITASHRWKEQRETRGLVVRRRFRLEWRDIREGRGVRKLPRFAMT
jgi:hypothetical protein